MKMKEFTQPISTEQDVKAFFRHLLRDLKINFHPDDDFGTYINMETHEPTMTDKEAYHYNMLMEKCFDVCGESVYDVANDLFKEEVGI